MKNERTILIVDDEEINVRLLKAMLTQENYRIIFALNGEEALAIVNDTNLDLILLDVMMLGMDGFKVCEKIKNNEKTRDIPVIMVTVLTGKENQLRALKAGADDFMSKPVSKSELLDRVKSMLRGHDCEGPPCSDVSEN